MVCFVKGQLALKQIAILLEEALSLP